MRRKITFVDNGIYHIYTRGIDGKVIFPDSSYYEYFISLMEHCLNYDYPLSTLKKRFKKAETKQERAEILRQLEERRIPPPVEFLCFCLMPTHPHLMLKQLEENGITDFLHRLLTAYSRYFNIRQKRKGPLYETTFRAVAVESDQQLIHLSRYQHINPKALGVDSLADLKNYPWSSLGLYLGSDAFPFVNSDSILSFFPNLKEYAQFIVAEIDEYEPLRLESVAIDDDFGWFAKFRELEEQQKKELREKMEMLSE